MRPPGRRALRPEVVDGSCGRRLLPGGRRERPQRSARGELSARLLAFELLREAHGLGYATEPGGAVATWAGSAGHERLWAGVRAWNGASRRVLAKLDFRESGRVESDPVHGDRLLLVRDLAHPSPSAGQGS